MDKSLNELKTEFEELNNALDYLVQSGNSYKAATEETSKVLKFLYQCQQNQYALYNETKNLTEKTDKVLEEAKSSLVAETQNINDKVNKTLEETKEMNEKTIDSIQRIGVELRNENASTKMAISTLESKLKTAIIIAASSLGTAVISIIVAIFT